MQLPHFSFSRVTFERLYLSNRLREPAHNTLGSAAECRTLGNKHIIFHSPWKCETRVEGKKDGGTHGYGEERSKAQLSTRRTGAF
jgi:hypothetical protein